MSPEQLERMLKDVPRHGTLVKDRGYRQIWRLELGGRGYYLKFYPRDGTRLKRAVRGSPARREFARLQLLQKAKVPAPRAVAQLVGFRLGDHVGDAVLIEAIEPAVQLDVYLNDLKLRGEPVPEHLKLAGQVRDLVQQLGRAKLGHNDLHLGNMLLSDGTLYLLDGYAVRPGGLRMNDLFLLGHSVSRFATRADVQRAWDQFGPGGAPPMRNPVSGRQWRKFVERARAGDNAHFGSLAAPGNWRGVYFKSNKFPRRWAPASAMNVTAEDWERAWPILIGQIESDQLTAIKRSPSGDVWSGEVILGGRPVAVVVKRPYKRYWYRYLNEIGRGSRAWRAWVKAWAVVARNLPTAWPLLVMERRSLGYVTDSLIVFERVAGPTLAAAELDATEPGRREMLFRRTGRILRRIEELGYSHFDAKASNWIVQADEKLGPRPVLIDVDGIRHRRWVALGIRRLLRSLRDHPQYTPADSLALCRGYAPFSKFIVPEGGETMNEER